MRKATRLKVNDNKFDFDSGLVEKERKNAREENSFEKGLQSTSRRDLYIFFCVSPYLFFPAVLAVTHML